MSVVYRCDHCGARRIGRWVGVWVPPMGWHTVNLEDQGAWESHGCSDKCKREIESGSIEPTPTSSSGVDLP